jgi:hypothetical protein
MDDKEIWLAAYLAALSAGAGNHPLTGHERDAADIAEEAVKDYYGRWGDEHEEEV